MNLMRRTIVVVLCCTAVLLAGYAGLRGYKVWKQKHLLTMAREFIAKGDGRNALLSLQQALSANSRNLEATRLMADLSETAHSPSTLLWRSRVVELDPTSVDDRLALARTAVALRDLISATNALEGVSSNGRKTASFQSVAGLVAVASGRLSDAELHFAEASRLEPTNPVPQLNLSVLRLRQTNEQVLAVARSTLRLLADNLSLRCQALRELVGDAMRHKQSDEALALSGELLKETNSVFSDRLLRLDVLHQADNSKFVSALADYRREAATNRAKVYELATWEIARRGPAQAMDWLKTVPVNVQTNQPVAWLEAECRTMLRDWDGLLTSLTNQDWAELEFVRHAFQARALREQNLAVASKTEWEHALNAAKEQKGNLIMLLRLTAQWNWRSEAEDLLWTVVNRYPNEKWASQALVRALLAGGRTRPLMSLYGQQLKRTPEDLSARNNLAMTALLLDAKELNPHDLAKEVYQKSPTNSSFASTYAFSLYLQGKNTEALQIMQQMKPSDLETPEQAGYYGIILKAAGDRERARAYLTRSSMGHLLPEEKKLFERAQAEM